MGKSILFVAAHPDDEALGCGGTVASHAARGDQVHVLIFCDGGTGVRGYEPDRSWRSGEELFDASTAANCPGFVNAHRAGLILGIKSLRVLAFPDTRFETLPILDYAHEVERALDIYKPSIVYTHHGGDLNMDHRWVHQAVVAACRPKPTSPIEAVLFFETPSSTDWAQGAFQPFIPTVFQRIEQIAWQKKEEALVGAYGVEMRGQGHPRSIENIKALAMFRGSAIGCPLAEAFMPGRIALNK